jgi:hypothetical protein
MLRAASARDRDITGTASDREFHSWLEPSTRRMNAKAKGTRAEHRSMRLLEASGYSVTRAAASLGAWDIIGVSATDVVLCQVKSNAWPGTAEMATLRNFAAPPNCRKLVHRWRDRQGVPDVRTL